MQWLRQFFRRGKPQIPEQLWRSSLAHLSFLQRLSDNEKSRLKILCETLLDRKTFTGAGGFTLTDDVAVQIAAQAALPILNLTPDLYNDMAGVIVYPSTFVIPQAEIDEAGVVHEWRAPVSGEAIDAGGAVVLSWEDVQQPNTKGHNVVIHEFAHKIDMSDGVANGCPPFLAAFHQDIDHRHWQQAFTEAYRDFQERIDHFSTLPLDPYAATHPAEFFAVASETFFVWPTPLAEAYPDVFRLLTMYYRQDPHRLAARKTHGKHL